MPEYINGVEASEVKASYAAEQEQQGTDLNVANEARLDRAGAQLDARAAGTSTTGPSFDPLSSSEDDAAIKLSNLMAEAQRKNDHLAIARIGEKMDQLVRGDLAFKKPAPAAKPSAETTEEVTRPTPRRLSDAEVVENYKTSEFRQELYNQYGEAEVNRTIDSINETGDVKLLRKFMEGSEDSHTVFEMHRIYSQQKAQGRVGGDVGFDQGTVDRISEKYGSYGDQVTELSNKVASGELSQSDAIGIAMKDPRLMAVAQQMLQNGDAHFAG